MNDGSTSTSRARWLLVWFLLGVTSCLNAQSSTRPQTAAKDEPYFPGGGTWETVSASDAGANPERLQAAIDFAGKKNSYGVVMLWRGRILAEQYWNGWDQNSVGPLYSSTKSLVSTLVGMAIDDGHIIGVEQPAADFLSEWKGKPEYEAIHIEHLLSMTSGLKGGKQVFFRGQIARSERAFTTSLPIDHVPGTHWDYHNGAYHLLFPILEAATKKSLDEYSKEKIIAPLGMEHARWFTRRRGDGEFNHMNMSTRDAARFGLLILREGTWQGKQLVSKAWLDRAKQPWNRDVNPSYGYLWWINGGDHYYLPFDDRRHSGPLLPGLPADTFGALGKDDQKIYVVPSLDLVVARLGDKAESSAQALSAFDVELLKRICSIFDKK